MTPEKCTSSTQLVYSAEAEVPTHKMFFLGFILLLPLLLCGMVTTFTSVALPQMHLGLDNSSSFGSLSLLLSPIGAIICGIVIDKYGRRTALLFTIIPGIVGWLLLYYSHNTTATMLGQVLNGILCGASGYPSQVYAGECIMAHNVRMRNRFLSWIAISHALGMFLTYVLGYYMHYRHIAACGAILSAVTFVLTFVFIPESPLWLYLQGRVGDAEWSQKRLGIHPTSADKRRVSVLLMDQPEQSRWSAIKAGLAKLRRSDVRKPLLVTVSLATCLSFIGGMSVVFYMVEVVSEPLEPNQYQFTSLGRKLYFTNETAYHVDDPYVYSMVSGALMVAANVLMSVALPVVGVRTILIVPLLGMGLGMAVEGYVMQRQFHNGLLPWHLGALWLVTLTYTSSISMIPDTMTADMFPVDAKGFASIPYLLESALVAAVLKCHPYLFRMIGGYLYYFYAFMCALSAAIVYFFIPEIVGRTLMQINDGFLD